MDQAGVEVVSAIRPDGSLSSDEAYVYHATNEENAREIAIYGLKAHRPDFGTDQDEWPDGSREKRIYFSPNASVVWQFAPEHGRPVVLRVPRSAPIKKERGTGDVYTTKSVAAKLIQILTDEGWVSISSWSPRMSNPTLPVSLHKRLVLWQGSAGCPIRVLAASKSPTKAQVDAALANLREIRPANEIDAKDKKETIRELEEWKEAGREGNPAPSFSKDLRKQIATSDRLKHRETVLALRKAIADIRRDRTEALRAVKIGCQSGIEVARKRAARLQRWAASTIALAQAECAANKKETLVLNMPDEEKKRRLLRDEQDLQRLLRMTEQKHAAKTKTKRSTKEAQQESDDEVEREIEPHLLPLWRKVRKSIKGGAKMSRHEAFLHYVEEHPEEALASIEENEPSEEDFEAAQRAYYEEEMGRRKANPIDTLSFVSSATRGHTHSVTVPTFDFMEDSVLPITYETSRDSGHMHRVRLTPCDRHAVGRGETVSGVTTSVDDGHSHTFSFSQHRDTRMDAKEFRRVGDEYEERSLRGGEWRKSNPATPRKQREDSVIIKGDEVSFIEVGEGDPDDREILAYKKKHKFGKGPKDYLTDMVMVHDPSGEQFRKCDIYIVNRLTGVAGAKNCRSESDSFTKEYYPGAQIDCGVALAKPVGPWQRVGQIDGIRYRRWWDEHGNGEYRLVPFEHPFDPAVTLYRSKNGCFKVALPDRCIVDERGFVFPLRRRTSRQRRGRRIHISGAQLMAVASGIGARRARAEAAAKKPRTKTRRRKRASTSTTPKETTKMATRKKRKKSAAKHTAAKSGTAPKKRVKRRRKKAASVSAAPAAAPRKRARRKAKKTGARRKARKTHRAKAAPRKRSKARRRRRKSNPASMAGHGPALKPITKAKARRKARGMKKTSTRTWYKSRNKRGPKKRYVVETRFPNPIGGGVKALALCGVGTLIGYELTDMADRYVATMAPSNAPNAWYASDAAHRIMARPTMMRVGAQALVAALFFGGSLLTAKRYPMVAAGLAGGFIGSVVHIGHQQMITRVWPALSATDKGNERIWGNRLYPVEQGKLQDLQDKAIAAQDKAVVDAKDSVAAMPPGQQDGATKGNLPDSYLYPTDIQYNSQAAMAQARRRAAAGALAGAGKELASPEARIREVDLRSAGRQTSTVSDEPRARAAGTPRVEPRAVAGTPDSDRSNQACRDSNGNGSVTDASGACIEFLSPPRATAAAPDADAPRSSTHVSLDALASGGAGPHAQSSLT